MLPSLARQRHTGPSTPTPASANRSVFHAPAGSGIVPGAGESDFLSESDRFDQFGARSESEAQQHPAEVALMHPAVSIHAQDRQSYSREYQHESSDGDDEDDDRFRSSRSVGDPPQHEQNEQTRMQAAALHQSRTHGRNSSSHMTQALRQGSQDRSTIGWLDQPLHDEAFTRQYEYARCRRPSRIAHEAIQTLSFSTLVPPQLTMPVAEPSSSSSSSEKTSRRATRFLGSLLYGRHATWTWCILVALAAIWVRLASISTPEAVVFDEVHVGGFVSNYVKGSYFFDVHPPLAKLVFTLCAWYTGYDGTFDFSTIGRHYFEQPKRDVFIEGVDSAFLPEKSQPPFIAMRTVSALAGALISPVAVLTLRLLGRSLPASVAAGLLLLFDNAMHTQSRAILLDSQLVLALAVAILCWVAFARREVQHPFSPRWWCSMVGCGVALACAISVKWVGLGLFAVIAVDQGVAMLRALDLTVDLGPGDAGIGRTNYVQRVRHSLRQSYDIADTALAMSRSTAPLSYSERSPPSTAAIPTAARVSAHLRHSELAVHVWARVLCFALIPAVLYVSLFYIHFALLPRPGPGMAFMDSEFQAFLQANGQQQPSVPSAETRLLSGANVSIGLAGNRQWLAHLIQKPSGDVAVGARFYDTYYDMLRIPSFRLHSAADLRLVQADAPDTGLGIHPGTELRLQAGTNPLFLSIVRGPDGDTSKVHLGGVASAGLRTAGWRFVDANQRVLPQSTRDRRKLDMSAASPIMSPVFIESTFADCRLAILDDLSHGSFALPDRNLTCVPKNSLSATMWSVFAPIRVPASKPYFVPTFFKLHAAMWRANANLASTHSYASKPSSWPFLEKGVSYWMHQGRQIYFLGNPTVWWPAAASVLVVLGMWMGTYVMLLISFILRRLATYGRHLFHSRINGLTYWMSTVCSPATLLLVVLYIVHFLPFYAFGRQLFLHHYLPALYVAVLTLCSLLDDVLALVVVRVVQMQHNPVMHLVTESAELRDALTRSTERRVRIVRLLVYGVLVAMALGTFVYLLPVTSGFPIDIPAGLKARQWRASWNFQYLG
ncbi:hypothetical protein CAOG_03833 [Capsaspora owczarzaki ATCC 30864]|uniref:hypothetical protein n=1 Tax=Capsaspora owczarzaki (strain ATCC 30864) TaxID=595528 RepID=UPI00035260C0|nr:hypothetical protein CAOG_03833 [Capsaspora owczarzaki ATCC 30864]|eukprot:XP_004363561.2 hypothetical protein CAOG_03833 [Capsaspora owczarzaki ATCC 30864]